MVYRVSKNPKQSRLIHTTARLVNDGKTCMGYRSEIKAAVADCLTETGKRANEIKNCLLWFSLLNPNIDDLRESPASMNITQQVANWHSGKNICRRAKYS